MLSSTADAIGTTCVAGWSAGRTSQCTTLHLDGERLLIVNLSSIFEEVTPLAKTFSLKAVILDWAGTTLDYGCYAPAVVFTEVFKRRGVEISMQEAREPMGRLSHP